MLASFLAALAGLSAGASLIIAIGAQNAFVLRQGIRKEHVLAIVAVCALSDVVLITAGVAGIGIVVEKAPIALVIVRVAGAVFLLGYAVLAAKRAIRPVALGASGGAAASLTVAVSTAVALTWLNPHVYLDTVLLLGSLASSHGDDRWWFALGASIASVAWFSALGFGARYLGRLFAKPLAWRILDATIAVVMISLAIALIVEL